MVRRDIRRTVVRRADTLQKEDNILPARGARWPGMMVALTLNNEG